MLETINGLSVNNYKELYKSPQRYLDQIALRALFGQRFLTDQYKKIQDRGYTTLAANYYKQLDNYTIIEQLAQHLDNHFNGDLVDIRALDKAVK
ncbi:hypothetical protein ACKP2L_03505 [Oenococcus alcoholitolerans]|uniref:hypothetical protein n=1 Tax=Oenococcus alcoholitolerans TaxID=931074 RepID=UPI003F70F56A